MTFHGRLTKQGNKRWAIIEAVWPTIKRSGLRKVIIRLKWLLLGDQQWLSIVFFTRRGHIRLLVPGCLHFRLVDPTSWIAPLKENRGPGT